MTQKLEGTLAVREFNVSSSEVGPDAKLKLSELFRLFEELAGVQLYLIGSDFYDAQRHGMLWMIRSQSIRIKRRPVKDEPVRIETNAMQMNGPFFSRDFQVLSHNSGRLAEATSDWFLVDAASRTVLRPDRIAGIQSEAHLLGTKRLTEIEPVRWRGKEVFAPERAQIHLTRCCLYNDQDSNSHLNNTRYIAWAEDLIDAYDPQLRAALSRVDILYMNEVGRGERVDCYLLKESAELDLLERAAWFGRRSKGDLQQLPTAYLWFVREDGMPAMKMQVVCDDGIN